MKAVAARITRSLISTARRCGIDVDESTLKQTTLEWAGCVVGLAGAFMLAFNTPISKYGWIAFLLANFATIWFARLIRANGLLVQQCGFTLSSLLGLYRAFWPHL
jgi:hypothetical protein